VIFHFLPERLTGDYIIEKALLFTSFVIS